MATKLNNEHLEHIINNSKNYNVLDTYIVLAHISSEVKGRYIIQTYSDNKADIVRQIKKYISRSYKTIYNQIDELINLGILNFNAELSSWCIIGMEKMTMSKSSVDNIEEKANLKGYTKIREFFLSSKFHKMKAIEKRCMVYLAQLCDSRASKSYNEFVMNLLKPNSKWLQVLKTKSKYYARFTINTMLNKYNDIFIDESNELRSRDLAPKTVTNFKFAFTCKVINKVEDDNSQYDIIKLHNKKEFDLVLDKIKFANITLSKSQIMHIVRSISTIKEWFLKERIVQVIVNKYIAIQIHRSREPINSLPAYLVAVTKTIVNEFKEFKLHLNNIRGEALVFEYLNNENNLHDINKSDLKAILKTI